MKWFWKWFHLNVYTSNRIRDRSIIFLNFIDDLHKIAKRSTSTVKDWLQIATLNVRSIFQPRPDPAQDRLINLFAQSRRRPRLINSLESRDNLLKGKTYLKMCHHSLNKENDDILLIRDIFIQYQNKSRKLLENKLLHENFAKRIISYHIRMVDQLLKLIRRQMCKQKCKK